MKNNRFPAPPKPVQPRDGTRLDRKPTSPAKIPPGRTWVAFLFVLLANYLLDALRKGDRESTSPGADVRASTTAREKAVTTRLILCTLSGLISGFAAICATIIYSTALEWRYFWLAVCVAGFVALCVFLWQACERFYGTEEGSGPV
jgi:hypothetical protein